MSVAVFSADAVIARMLLLEAKRCGLQSCEPERAEVWLVDLDHLPPMPKRATPSVQIGFSKTPEKYAATGAHSPDTVLPLPFLTQALAELLCRREPIRAALHGERDALWLSGKKMHFSKTEQRLIGLLFQNKDRVLTIREVNDALGERAENSNAAAVYIYRLRSKLEADGTKRIRTVRGVGYQWIGEDRI